MSEGRTRSQSGKLARTKGANFERNIAKSLEKWWGNGSEFRRSPGSGAWSTIGAARDNFQATSGDIAVSDPNWPWTLELKKQEVGEWDVSSLLTSDKGPLSKWWAQACDECPTGRSPMLIAARNRVDPLAFLLLDDFLNLCKDGLNCLKCPYFIAKIGDQKLLILSLKEFLQNVDPKSIAGYTDSPAA